MTEIESVEAARPVLAAMVRESEHTEHVEIAELPVPPVPQVDHRARLAAFVEHVQAKMDRGSRDYGDGSWSRDAADLCREVQAELADVCGWSCVMWHRLGEISEAMSRMATLPPADEQSAERMQRLGAEVHRLEQSLLAERQRRERAEATLGRVESWVAHESRESGVHL